LFRQQGRPQPRPEHFSPRQLQRTIAGQAGVQYFFQENGRAFCSTSCSAPTATGRRW